MKINLSIKIKFKLNRLKKYIKKKIYFLSSGRIKKKLINIK